jgi:hypothetical protein
MARRGMGITVAVRIQHHASRSALLPRLLIALQDFEDVEIVSDPESEGKPDSWRAFRACLLAMPKEATHLLCIQDDAVPCEGFAEKMATAIDQHPESVLLPFTPGFPHLRRLMLQAQSERKAFAPFTPGAFIPLVTIAFPRQVAEGLLAWADQGSGDRFRRPMRGADDGVVAAFARARRFRPLAMVPSIVQHDDLIASVGKNTRSGPHRRAALL